MISVALTQSIPFTAFWLSFTRWLALLMQLPLFEETNIPTIIKILTSVLIAYAFFPFTKEFVIQDMNVWGENSIISLTLYHSAVGLSLGFFVKIIMTTFIGAGSLISQQIGFVAMRFFDPNFGGTIGPFEVLIRWSVLILVIMSGALLPMFKGGLATFETINLTTIGQLIIQPEVFVSFFKNMILSALLLASPILFTNLLIMCVMGVIARTIPQMNVLMVSFVVSIGVGLFVMLLTMNEFLMAAFQSYVDSLGVWFQFVTQ